MVLAFVLATALGVQAGQTNSKPPAVQPKTDAPSPRIAKLERDLAAGVRNAEDAFWKEVSSTGTPLIEGPAGADEVLVTFVWRQNAPTTHVHLWWGGHDDSYFLRRVPRTSVWYTTLRLRDDSRFVYAFSPNDRPEDRAKTLVLDPFNPKRFPESEPAHPPVGGSLFEMPGAPDLSWATKSPAKNGTLQEIQFKARAYTAEPIGLTLYTPPGYRPGSGPYPLLVLLPASQYTSGVFDASRILDNLIEAGRIRPVIACFIDPPAAGAFKDASLVTAIATEIVPQLRSRYAISRSAADVTIGGFSGGAKNAAAIAFAYPAVFGNVLSQAAGLQEADPSGRPNAIARAFEDGDKRPIRLYLDVGLYEPNTGRNREWRDVLVAKGYDVIYRERGLTHHPLHWAATLPEALMALVPPRR